MSYLNIASIKVCFAETQQKPLVVLSALLFEAVHSLDI